MLGLVLGIGLGRGLTVGRLLFLSLRLVSDLFLVPRIGLHLCF